MERRLTVGKADETATTIYSMTGVGVARGMTELGELTVEARSVNGRNLQVKVRLPNACQGFDADIEQRVRRKLRRGQVRFVAEVTAPAETAEPIIDEERAAEAARTLTELAQRLHLPGGPTLEDVLAVPGVLITTQTHQGQTSREPSAEVAALFDQAIAKLLEQRAAEGRATLAAVTEQLDALAAEREAAAARAPAMVDDYRDKLLQRVNQFLADQARQMDDQDVLRELSLFADRVDVSEELQRIEAHVEQARSLLAGGGEVGRKLEFLLQETLREINTLGSKSPDVEMSRTVVNMKSIVDKIREQAANLE